jgi:hypothetical protein
MVQVAEPYVGKYFSQDYVRRKILRQTDVEILEQDELIKKEIEDGIIPDPSVPVDPETGMPLDQTSQMDLGKPVMEPDLEAQSSSVGVPEMEPPTAPKIPKGGEI